MKIVFVKVSQMKGLHHQVAKIFGLENLSLMDFLPVTILPSH